MISSSINELCIAFRGHEQTWGNIIDSLLRSKMVDYHTPSPPSTQKFVTNMNKATGLVSVGDRSRCKDMPVVCCFTRQSKDSKKLVSVGDRRSRCKDMPVVCSFTRQSRESEKIVPRTARKQHHLWQKRDSAQSGHKALNLIRNISGLPNEKEAIYGALDEWVAWETEFPLIAAAKALRMLRKRNQWIRVIQVAKWMLSKGQGATMETYDTLILAFDMERRIDEAESLWDMILRVHTRSTSKRLFSRMISLYDHHRLPDKIMEVFADMEELGVRPDEDTLKRIAQAFETLGQQDKKKLVLSKYGNKWKYIHFKGERVRVRNNQLE